MIRISSPRQAHQPTPSWHQTFLRMLPSIQRQARFAFRHLDAEARADMVEEVVANAFVAYTRLVEQDRADLAYATPLASFGIRQARAGRRIGTKSNVNDVSSPYAQAARRIHVERLDQCNEETGMWKEILLEDRRSTPCQIAICRIDFAAWLESLTRRYRKIATILAMGETTKETAKRFDVSSGRISQVRRELKESWEVFQGEAKPPAPAV